MGRVGQSRGAIRGCIIKVALRTVGVEIYQNLPESLQNTTQSCPLNLLATVSSWLAVASGQLCVHGY